MIAENRAVVNPVIQVFLKIILTKRAEHPPYRYNQYFTAEGIFSAIQVMPSVVRCTRSGTV